MRRLLFAAGWAVLTVLAGGAVWWGLSPLLGASGPWFARPDPQVSTSVAVPGSTPPPVGTSPPITPRTTTGKPTATATSTPNPQSSSYDGWTYANGVFTRGFDMLGGTATVRIANGSVDLVSQSAKSGYTFSTVPRSTTERLVIRFDKPGAASIIDAMWWNGNPFAELSEIK